MSRLEHIKVFHQRDERYAGLQLEYSSSAGLKEEILGVFELVKDETGLAPDIYEDIALNAQELFYIEFGDEHDRESGKFFTTMLHQLGIETCQL